MVYKWKVGVAPQHIFVLAVCMNTSFGLGSDAHPRPGKGSQNMVKDNIRKSGNYQRRAYNKTI